MRRPSTPTPAPLLPHGTRAENTPINLSRFRLSTPDPPDPVSSPNPSKRGNSTLWSERFDSAAVVDYNWEISAEVYWLYRDRLYIILILGHILRVDQVSA